MAHLTLADMAARTVPDREKSPAKSSKRKANYRAGTDDRHCGICTMFHAPHGCTAVRGRVSSGGLCNYFKEKSTRATRWYGSKEN